MNWSGQKLAVYPKEWKRADEQRDVEAWRDLVNVECMLSYL
jgi:hypothetical protein